MSTGMHAVLQKLDKNTGEFKTVLTDVFCQDYSLMNFLSGVRGFPSEYDNIAHPGFPADFIVGDRLEPDGTISHGYHEDYWMGEHSFGWITLKEFCDAKLPDPPSIADKFEIEKTYSGYTVTFKERDEEYGDPDEYSGIRAYQYAFKHFFDTWSQGSSYGETYRLVFGYDS